LREASDSGRLASGVPMPARKRAWPRVAVGGLMVLALSGAWLSLRAASALPQTLVRATSYPGSELYPSFSPDGRQLAFTWDGDKADNANIYVKLVGETNALRLTTDPADDTFPVWAPDGKRTAFRRAGPTAASSPSRLWAEWNKSCRILPRATKCPGRRTGSGWRSLRTPHPAPSFCCQRGAASRGGYRAPRLPGSTALRAFRPMGASWHTHAARESVRATCMSTT
jgi:WD40-like Beta Propeller Repeat